MWVRACSRDKDVNFDAGCLGCLCESEVEVIVDLALGFKGTCSASSCAKGAEKDAGWWGDGGELCWPLFRFLRYKGYQLRTCARRLTTREAVNARDGGVSEQCRKDLGAL